MIKRGGLHGVAYAYKTLVAPTAAFIKNYYDAGKSAVNNIAPHAPTLQISSIEEADKKMAELASQGKIDPAFLQITAKVSLSVQGRRLRTSLCLQVFSSASK